MVPSYILFIATLFKIYHTDFRTCIIFILYENEYSRLFIILWFCFENKNKFTLYMFLSPFRQEIDHMNHEKLRRLAKEAFLEVLNLSDEQVNQIFWATHHIFSQKTNFQFPRNFWAFSRNIVCLFINYRFCENMYWAA